MVTITSGLAFLSGLGLAQVLLWVLTFAIVFEVVRRTGVLQNKPTAAIVSAVAGVLVLMTAPTAVITAISSMSTGLIVAAIGFLVVHSIIEIGNIKFLHTTEDTDKDGNKTQKTSLVHPFNKHARTMLVVGLIVAAAIFMMAGGPGLIGIGHLVLPTISYGTWVLIAVVAAVYWMVK